MDNQSPSMLKATLIGGAALGVAGGMPILGMLNCACCVLIVSGGFLAAFLYSRECTAAGVPFRPGNGAVVGLVAGLFYTIASSVVGGFFQLIIPTDPEQLLESLEQANMPPEMMESLETWIPVMAGGGGFIFMFFITLLLAAAFSTIGGLIGGAVFKFEPPAPPAAPQAPDFVPSQAPPPPQAPPLPGPESPGGDASGDGGDDDTSGGNA